MFDKGEWDPEKMFIFSSEIGIRFLSESEHWFSGICCVCTATWKYFPCIFALFANKTEATYIKFYRKVFNRVRWQGNNSDDILLHFESAAINPIHHLNQHIEIKGYFYHLS